MRDIKLFPCRFCGEIPEIIEYPIIPGMPYNSGMSPSAISEGDSCGHCYSVEIEVMHRHNYSNRTFSGRWIAEIWNARNEKFNPFIEAKDA